MNAQTQSNINKTAKKTMWRTDTRALVGAVILGVAFILTEFITAKIDSALWSPLIIVDGITWATFTGLITLVFRQPASLIMTEIQAFSAMATGQFAFAIFFVPANAIGSLVYSLFASKLSMEKWSHHFIAQIFTNFLGNIPVAIGLHYVLQLPWNVVITSSVITSIAGIIGASILTKVLYDALRKSGLVQG